MENYVLSCCSTADLTREHFEEAGLHYICFHYYMDGVHYTDDLGESIPFKDFYEAIEKGAQTKTSQINISEYLDYFEGFLREGLDVLHVCLSGGLSGSCNSAANAANIAMERYPGRRVTVIDSLCASSGYGLLMDKAAELRRGGMDMDTLAQWILDNRLRLHHWFFSGDLSHYVRGGRISKAAGFFGGIVGICPLLNMDDKGHLVPRQKLRGKKRAITEIVERMVRYAQGGLEYSGKCYISQSNCMEDAQAVAQAVEARFPRLRGRVEINHIGTTIGSHTGPGTVALYFWGDSREGK